MGAPSRKQIDEAIAAGLARGDSEADIIGDINGLHRLSDEELAAMGIRPNPPEPEPQPECASPLDFEPVPRKPRHDGWTAERQRAFIRCLAETGCVSEACAEVGITPRSAYRLRDRPEAKSFRLAWVHAQTQAVTRLTSIAFERAIHGSTEQFYRDGALVAERRKPSDRLLMFLLKHFDPVEFGWMQGTPVPPEVTNPRTDAIAALPKQLAKMKDVEPEACRADPLSAHDLIDSGASRA